ncbi:hypothetical protein ACJRO7_027257 [Eucalyptus globulus]|uniref:Phytosulfokine n=1 Tax=Eucalyptus globulus TaxID=34317 RepID=A0ABD3K385_EUCGL
MSPRVKCLAVLALLAVSFAAVSSAARPLPASRGAASASTTGPQPQVGEDCGDGRGGGGGGAEECLMRRTLDAHLDYIYTQNHQP